MTSEVQVHLQAWRVLTAPIMSELSVATKSVLISQPCYHTFFGEMLSKSAYHS